MDPLLVQSVPVHQRADDVIGDQSIDFELEESQIVQFFVNDACAACQVT